MSTSGGAGGVVPANGYGITGNTGQTPTPAVDLTVVSSYISGPVTITAAATDITSKSFPAGTYLVSAPALFQSTDTTAADFIDLWLGPTSASSTSAYVGTSDSIDESGLAGTESIRSLTIPPFELVLASTMTVYLTAILDANVGAGLVRAVPTSWTSHVANVTGLTAVRIA